MFYACPLVSIGGSFRLRLGRAGFFVAMFSPLVAALPRWVNWCSFVVEIHNDFSVSYLLITSPISIKNWAFYSARRSNVLAVSSTNEHGFYHESLQS